MVVFAYAVYLEQPGTVLPAGCIPENNRCVMLANGNSKQDFIPKYLLRKVIWLFPFRRTKDKPSQRWRGVVDVRTYHPMQSSSFVKEEAGGDSFRSGCCSMELISLRDHVRSGSLRGRRG